MRRNRFDNNDSATTITRRAMSGCNFLRKDISYRRKQRKRRNANFTGGNRGNGERKIDEHWSKPFVISILRFFLCILLLFMVCWLRAKSADARRQRVSAHG